jgi:hypothetical protein
MDDALQGPSGTATVREHLAQRSGTLLRNFHNQLTVPAFTRVLRAEAPDPLKSDLQAQLDLFSALNTSGSGRLSKQELAAGLASVSGQDAFLEWAAQACKD